MAFLTLKFYIKVSAKRRGPGDSPLKGRACPQISLSWTRPLHQSSVTAAFFRNPRFGLWHHPLVLVYPSTERSFVFLPRFHPLWTFFGSAHLYSSTLKDPSFLIEAVRLCGPSRCLPPELVSHLPLNNPLSSKQRTVSTVSTSYQRLNLGDLFLLIPTRCFASNQTNVPTVTDASSRLDCRWSTISTFRAT